MAYNFPSNPSDGQEYSTNGKTYTFNNSKGTWDLKSLIGEVNAANGFVKLDSNGDLPAVGGENVVFNKTPYIRQSVDVNITAENGYHYMCDTTSGSFTITLPSAPTEGFYFKVHDVANAFSTNNMNIDPNGSTIMGLSEILVCNIGNDSFEMIFFNNDWRFI
jgi:hypothetical protein